MFTVGIARVERESPVWRRETVRQVSPVGSAHVMAGESGGQRDKLVGCSTHGLDQVHEADASSADYIAFGPIFATQSKERPDPLVGLEGLREARKATRKPLVAIGGITVENARAVLEAGADSVAVIRDLLNCADVETRTRQWVEALGRF